VTEPRPVKLLLADLERRGELREVLDALARLGDRLLDAGLVVLDAVDRAMPRRRRSPEPELPDVEEMRAYLRLSRVDAGAPMPVAHETPQRAPRQARAARHVAFVGAGPGRRRWR
jgi:hypothetical protein